MSLADVPHDFLQDKRGHCKGEKGKSMTKQTEIARREYHGASAVPGSRAAPRLTSQWYKDANGKLVMRWAINVQVNERRLSDALAA